MRTTTWASNTFGTEATSNNYIDLLTKADLNYQATSAPIFAEYNGQKVEVLDKKAIIREDTQELLGVVSNRYKVCQNVDALSFIENINDIKLLKAGSVGTNNSTIYMIGQLPEVKVLGDIITPHVIFQNSHDGLSGIKATICMLRVVCQNQFISTFANSPAVISIRHQGDLDGNLIAARDTMNSMYEYVRTYDQFANNMVAQKVDSKMFNQILEGYFKIPEDATDRMKSNILDCREYFTQCYNVDDNQNFKGTKYGLINAFSDYITHKEPMKKSTNWEKSRFANSINPYQMDQFRRVVDSIAA